MVGVGAPRPWPKKWQRALREGRSVPRSHVVTAGPGRATFRRLPRRGSRASGGAPNALEASSRLFTASVAVAAARQC